jgi:hypothetical protein
MNDFDWVSARGNCSLAAVFESLKQDVQRDVNVRNQIDGMEVERYKVVMRSDTVSVLREEMALLHDAIAFVLTKNGIEVKDVKGQVTMTATPTLTDDGRCLLKVGGKECEIWQFRKRALEELLFGG